MTHKVLDLFAGIGGFSLGLERTQGFETVAFCEFDKKAQMVLNKHWPNVPIYNDVKELTVDQLSTNGIIPTVITGGFPCQDISSAGKGEGIIGERSGLWSEMFRLIRDVRPAWAIIENVSVLRSRGLTLVLQNLCEIGYCAEWHCIPASAVGAPHQRDRIWIIAHCNTNCNSEPISPEYAEASGMSEYVAYPVREHSTERGERENAESQGNGRRVEPPGREGNVEWERSIRGAGERTGKVLAYTNVGRGEDGRILDGVGGVVVTQDHIRLAKESSKWKVEPRIPRVVDGFPGRVDRLKQLGNSVVPQIPQLIGQAILDYENQIEAERAKHEQRITD